MGTTKGFSIFSLEPLRFRVKRQIEGGVKVVQMVNKTNLILVITTGQDTNYPASYLHFWDDLKLRFVGRINQFDSDPVSICHADNIITVGLENKVCCLKMGALEIFSTINSSQAQAEG